MVKLYEKYDLLLQNTGSKHEWVISGLTSASNNPLYYEFPDFEMPEDAPEGEYLYALIFNVRNDVQYRFQDDFYTTIIHTNDGDIKIADVQCNIGVMKYGKQEIANKYRSKNKNYIYRNR